MGWSPYTDLERPPLSQAALRRALVVDGGVWTGLDYRPRTGSTNADVAAAARAGAPEGYVVVADEQTAGRGRLERVVAVAAARRDRDQRPAAPGSGRPGPRLVTRSDVRVRTIAAARRRGAGRGRTPAQ